MAANPQQVQQQNPQNTLESEWRNRQDTISAYIGAVINFASGLNEYTLSSASDILNSIPQERRSSAAADIFVLATYWSRIPRQAIPFIYNYYVSRYDPSIAYSLFTAASNLQYFYRFISQQLLPGIAANIAGYLSSLINLPENTVAQYVVQKLSSLDQYQQFMKEMNLLMNPIGGLERLLGRRQQPTPQAQQQAQQQALQATPTQVQQQAQQTPQQQGQQAGQQQ